MATDSITRRPRISQEFIRDNQRRRLILGAAKAISEKNYASTTVADIVSATGVARNTFYDNFGSKRGVADALLKAVAPGVAEVFNAPSRFGDGVMAIEIVASHHAGENLRAASEVKWARRALDSLAALEPRVVQADESPLLATLPPGRHGLDPEFVAANQKRRLLDGYALSVLAYGYFGATIADVTEAAAVSRRTFYEHFRSTEHVARALQADAFDSHPVAEEVSSGIGAVTVEIVSAVRMDSPSLDSRREFTERVVETLATSLEVR